MGITVKIEVMEPYFKQGEMKRQMEAAAGICEDLLTRDDREKVLGWRDAAASKVQLDLIQKKAAEIRERADVFVIVGVGGSNQASRAMIEAMTRRRGPEILYLGNTLSPYYISDTLAKLEGKSVYINVIAKNFETLEPGSHFRILRRYMSSRYTKAEMAERIIVTGSVGSRLEEIAQENGYLFLQFPASVGGRYSAFTSVCLLPVAAAGLDISRFLEGMKQAAADCRLHPDTNPATVYGAVRNLLYQKGFDVEMLVSFEPQLSYLTKWWVQLFGESEGKEKKGIFPASAIYSEDLHSIGQYMQAGRRNLMETFLSVRNPGTSVIVEPDPGFKDRFDYLDGMDFDQINKVAERATLEAHRQGGVPCVQFELEDIGEKTFGALFYYFMVSCAVSGILMGVNPFDQEGVEEYKRSMFAALGK